MPAADGALTWDCRKDELHRMVERILSTFFQLSHRVAFSRILLQPAPLKPEWLPVVSTSTIAQFIPEQWTLSSHIQFCIVRFLSNINSLKIFVTTLDDMSRYSILNGNRTSRIEAIWYSYATFYFAYTWHGLFLLFCFYYFYLYTVHQYY